jgi:protein-tyrosine phosphatase
MMQDRIKPLEGVLNFRDFGGYDGAGGGTVVTGKLFRTASFAEATAKDIAWLAGLDAKFVVDLRRPEERTEMPNLWPEAHLRVITNDEGYKELPPHIGVLMETDLTADAVRAYMTSAYAHYPYEPRYVALFKAWLHGLANEGGPAIVHCAAGKDRTGVACMLVLTALGVDRDTITTDYELTNVAVDLEARMPMIRQRISERRGTEVSAEAIRPMLGVHRDYLASAYDAIEKKYGDVPAYMNAVLGVDEAMVAKLRERFLV